VGLHVPSGATRSDGRPKIDGSDQTATLAPPDSRPGPRTSEMRRRIARVEAKGRLEGELRSIAIDLLGPNEADELPPTCADWVATTTEAAASRVSDAALEALVHELDSLIVSVPPDVARQLDRARARHDAGFD
jgi:hypothetical protein